MVLRVLRIVLWELHVLDVESLLLDVGTLVFGVDVFVAFFCVEEHFKGEFVIFFCVRRSFPEANREIEPSSVQKVEFGEVDKFFLSDLVWLDEDLSIFCVYERDCEKNEEK